MHTLEHSRPAVYTIDRLTAGPSDNITPEGKSIKGSVTRCSGRRRVASGAWDGRGWEVAAGLLPEPSSFLPHHYARSCEFPLTVVPNGKQCTP